MNIRVRKLLTTVLIGLALAGSFATRNLASVHAAPERLQYYGANLQDVQLATGVHLDGTVDPKGPWPQLTQFYCFLAGVQAVVNYDDIMQELPLRYPHQSDQGPASALPQDEQVGQILWDMDHLLIPPDRPLVPRGSGVNRRPFTLGNIAYDFGGDPHIHAAAINFEAPSHEMKYHEHIYHTNALTATWHVAKTLARFRQPILVFANHAEHTLLVAGFWATGNILTDPQARIRSLAVFNPWNSAAFGQYITTGPYQQVSLDDWLNATNLPTPFGGVTTLWNLPYASNGDLDPDPSIGIYQAGPGTQNPTKHHWIGNFVTVEPDLHSQSANFTFDENNDLMLEP